MSLTLTPLRVATGSDGAQGQLVFDDGYLVAVLVQLSNLHGDDAGQWFLAAGFGRVDRLRPPIFADLDKARAWIIGQRGSGPLRPR